MSIRCDRSDDHYDVIVIGGGPAGMMAAGSAAKRGRRVLLVEKNKVLGKKLSITGGGRCNILNAEDDVRTLLSHYGVADKFLFSPFSQFGVPETFTFFESRGLPIVVQGRKRAFPETEDARDVTATMERYITDHQVAIKTQTTVKNFIIADAHIVGIETDQGDYFAEQFILATGGVSRPETGSTGEGLQWLTQLGHTVHDSNPNIVPLIVAENWVKQLSGTTLKHMQLKLKSAQTSTRLSLTGELLFTHFGLSGPLILNSAQRIKAMLSEGPVSAYVDLFPGLDTGTVRTQVLQHFTEHPNKTVRNVIKTIVPPGLAGAVASHLSSALVESKVHNVSRTDRHRLADTLQALPLTITGVKGMNWAVVSDGGVDLAEVDTRTMRSKKHANLYLIGDVLHISRPSGGYSLQLCWTTGYVAGQNV